MADKGGGGLDPPPFLADLICEQPLMCTQQRIKFLEFTRKKCHHIRAVCNNPLPMLCLSLKASQLRPRSCIVAFKVKANCKLYVDLCSILVDNSAG